MLEGMTGWRARVHEIIFEADTPAGKRFDVFLMVSILLSVAVVMLDSVASIHASHGRLLYGLEWFFTILFTIEYCLRIACVGRPTAYMTSFFGVVDLLAIVPTYLSILVPEHLEAVPPLACRNPLARRREDVDEKEWSLYYCTNSPDRETLLLVPLIGTDSLQVYNPETKGWTRRNAFDGFCP